MDSLTAERNPDNPTIHYQTPAARLVAWIPYGDDDLVPELWTHTLSPEENCHSLNLRAQMYDMKLDFQMFALLDGRHFFFARDSEHSNTYTTCVELVFD